MDVPNVSRKEYQLLYVDEGLLNLIGGDNTSNSGIKLPEGELGDKIQEYDSAGVEVLITVVSAMGEEQAVSCKEASK
jgi:translation initiation factor 5A